MDMEPSEKSDKQKRPEEGIKTTTPPTRRDDGPLPTTNPRDTRRKDRPRKIKRLFPPFRIRYQSDVDKDMDVGINQGGEKLYIDDFPPVNNPGVIVPAGVRALGAEVPPPAEPRA